MKMPITRPHRQQGSFLIEALISLLIFAIGLISLVGLSTQSLNQAGQSKARNDASYLASELIGEMWVSPSPATFDTGGWISRVQSALPGGNAAVTVTQGSSAQIAQVAITITWADPKNQGVQHQYATTAQIAK